MRGSGEEAATAQGLGGEPGVGLSSHGGRGGIKGCQEGWWEATEHGDGPGSGLHCLHPGAAEADTPLLGSSGRLLSVASGGVLSRGSTEGG